ncbi:hypothetical protein F511_33950 [Dorcoceras hygrometricum]|uniref:Uncharacterized protein n=1 Tax=Dorcoceras hygrometricum TaxID=472368 RepID=A0A2Z7C7D4_9LAMI|nr:hypothetical protein F511_33950 [Dorcoceras hygrometricum]
MIDKRELCDPWLPSTDLGPILGDMQEHCDVLSMQIDSDLVIYRTTLLRTFQVSTRSVLGKCVYLVTLAMSLFDLQDVRIAIGSIATLDLPMVVDLIEIYGLKGPYCTLTTTNWFLHALSVIPRGSWGDVARRSFHDPMGKSGIVIPEPQWFCIPEPLRVTQVLDSRFPHGYSAQCVEHTKRILGVRLPERSKFYENQGHATARGAAVRRAMAHDGRLLRALPPRDFVVAAAPAGRRSGEAPAMS